MNKFFTRFEKLDFSSDYADLKSSLSPCGNTVHDQKTVAKYLKATNVNKSRGPDGICGRTLQYCADQLSRVFRYRFQTSVDTATIPTIWKTSTIIPIVATVESVLLYGAETWTMTVKHERALDGDYTRMLRMALDVSWEDRVPNIKVRERRMRLAGHCVCHPELYACLLVLWEPVDGARSRGRRRLTYVDQLKKDAAQQETAELKTLMLDRDVWKATIRGSRDGVG